MRFKGDLMTMVFMSHMGRIRLMFCMFYMAAGVSMNKLTFMISFAHMTRINQRTYFMWKVVDGVRGGMVDGGRRGMMMGGMWGVVDRSMWDGGRGWMVDRDMCGVVAMGWEWVVDGSSGRVM